MRTGASVRLSADRLRQAAATGVACAPVRDLLGDTDVSAAYEVQRLLEAEWVASGGQVVGRKIGLTSLAVQQQLGVGQPDFGTLFADTVFSDGEALELHRFLQPKVEAEVAFVLGNDIASGHPTVADVIRATEFVLPAIEVVDSRIANWDIRITDTIADNASFGAVVLGTVPRSLEGLDLPGVGMMLEHNGQVLSTGAGRACLGSPTIAVTWLAQELARRGTPLVAGDIVLSGALGPMAQVTAPGVYRASIGGIGDVSAVFTEGGDR